jgi:hypothetical protein
LLTIAAITAITAVIGALMPAINRAGQALVSSADVADARLSSQIEIVHATGSDGDTVTLGWVKNIGATAVIAVSKSDVFFGPETDFLRIPYGDVGCTAPCWNFNVENDTQWNPTSTIRITVFLASPLATGTTYYFKIVAPTGVEDTKFFTV